MPVKAKLGMFCLRAVAHAHTQLSMQDSENRHNTSICTSRAQCWAPHTERCSLSGQVQKQHSCYIVMHSSQVIGKRSCDLQRVLRPL